jgi:hypothetical protein
MPGASRFTLRIGRESEGDFCMDRYRVFAALLLAMALLSGCATPTAKIHYTLKEHPDSRPLRQVVLLPVDVDVKEMSAGGVEEEVPDWSLKAEENIRSALLIATGQEGGCCVTRAVDSSSLTPEERESLEEHLALFNTVAANAMWVDLPGNSAWHFKSEKFDYTLGDGLSFLKTRYGIDAGLIILGEDVVSTGGRKAMAILAAAGGLYVPLGHTILVGGLVDFETGDLLWLNHTVSAGNADLRDPASSLNLARKLMEDYPGMRALTGSTPSTGD